MNLSIDFESLTMDEAEHLETITGIGLDAIGKRLQDEAAPKMGLLKALASIAYARDKGVTMKVAAKEVGKLPIASLTDAVEVTSEGNSQAEDAQ